MNDLTRSRCEYLLRNNKLVNDWNTVVEQLLMAHPKVVKKKKKKIVKKKQEQQQNNDKNAQIKILVERIEGIRWWFIHPFFTLNFLWLRQ